MKNIRLILSVICIGFLSGCLKKNPRVSSFNAQRRYPNSSTVVQDDFYKEFGAGSWIENANHDSVFAFKQQEARLIDIPIPLHAQALRCGKEQSELAEKDSFLLAYRVYLKPRDIVSFFMIEMERLGWNMIANVDDVESLLVFVKPTKVCTISLRHSCTSDGSSLMVIAYASSRLDSLSE